MLGETAVLWSSRRYPTVSLSACGAEYKTTAEAIQEAELGKTFVFVRGWGFLRGFF